MSSVRDKKRKIHDIRTEVSMKNKTEGWYVCTRYGFRILFFSIFYLLLIAFRKCRGVVSEFFFFGYAVYVTVQITLFFFFFFVLPARRDA